MNVSMKLVIILCVVNIFIIVQIASACDFCNCYLGLNPHYKKNSIGLRYQYMSYSGSHMEQWQMQKLDYAEDDFLELRTVTELHAQYYPVQKLQLLATIPYIYNSERNTVGYIHHHGNDGNSSVVNINQGIGDPYLLAHYQVFNKVPMDTSLYGYSQRLMAGGGIKFPVGQWKIADGVADNERIHLPGSGSWDFIASVVYLGKLGRLGLNMNLSYMFTTENRQSFSYGNRSNGNVVLYFQSKLKQVSVLPSTGIYYEQAISDLANGYELQNTGGRILYAHSGLDLYYRRISLSGTIQIPFSQTLNKPQPAMNYRITTGISYIFN